MNISYRHIIWWMMISMFPIFLSMIVITPAWYKIFPNEDILRQIIEAEGDLNFVRIASSVEVVNGFKQERYSYYPLQDFPGSTSFLVYERQGGGQASIIWEEDGMKYYFVMGAFLAIGFFALFVPQFVILYRGSASKEKIIGIVGVVALGIGLLDVRISESFGYGIVYIVFACSAFALALMRKLKFQQVAGGDATR